MANFFDDNEDIRFLFNHLDLGRLAALTEEEFRFKAEFDFAPADAADAIDNYRRLLELVGGIAGERVARLERDITLADSKTVKPWQ